MIPMRRDGESKKQYSERTKDIGPTVRGGRLRINIESDPCWI